MSYDLKNGKCKHCGEGYHHCSSCGTDTAAENGFCSSKCLNESKELAGAKENAQILYNSLDTQQRKRFIQFIDDHDSYEFMDLFVEEK